MDVTNYTTCEGSVLPLTKCSFKCSETGNSVLTVTCETTGSWNKGLPKCGSKNFKFRVISFIQFIYFQLVGWNTLDINVVHMGSPIFGNSNIFKEITYTTALATLVEIKYNAKGNVLTKGLCT